MPVAAAIAIRYVIMAAVQLGIWWLLEKYGIPLLNAGVQAIMEKFGVDEQTAKDIMANKIIVAFEEVGIFAATLRTKMPIKVAEYLGFTTKGYALRKVSSAAGLAAEKAAISATTKTVATVAEVEKVAEVVSKSSGWAIKGVGDLLKYVTLFVGTPVGFFYALAQFIDYGAWQNPYQKTFQGLLSYIGINVSDPLPSAKVISQDNWKRIYNTIEQLKPLGISMPFSGQDLPYSRENLAKVTDEIAANMVKVGTQPTYKNVIAAVLLTLQFGGKEPNVPTFPSTAGTTQQASTGGNTGGGTTNAVKVFTGIISQGVVGEGLVFTPRQDDMIDSVNELRDAAANNLAPYLASLPSKVVYEVKVVPSITTKDGFKQTGTTQKIQIGTYSNGAPKYKTVTNKFATLILYILTDRGTRTKLTTVVLGPVNSAKLTVAQNDLRALELALPKIVTTSDVQEITKITTTKDVAVNTVAPQGQLKTTLRDIQDYYTANNIGKFILYEGNILRVPGFQDPTNPNATSGLGLVLSNPNLAQLDMTQVVNGGAINWNDASGISHTVANEQWQRAEQIGTLENLVYTINTVIARKAEEKRIAEINANVSASATVPAVSQSAVNVVKDKASATTLFEWYQAQGQSVPSIAARAQLYQDYGLGQASYYTGTAEQNTKLLGALKSGTNVATSNAPEWKGYIDNGALGVL